MYKSFVTLLMIISGGLLLAPLTAQLPLLGWDWYYFFTAHHPHYTLYSANSAYPPFARYFIEMLTWLPWRDSFAILGGITLVSITIGTWRAGGGYGSIVLALFSAPVWMLLWVGHPDGLALAGVVSGFFPLTLIKPQITSWSLLADRRRLVASLLYLALTMIVWPLWPFNFRYATVGHEADLGWKSTGYWPVAMLGLLLLVRAGRNPWRLMAAGSLVSPYLMPFHLVVLVPAIGAARGWKKGVLLLASWVVFFGAMLWRPMNIVILLYPLSVYTCLSNFREVARFSLWLCHKNKQASSSTL